MSPCPSDETVALFLQGQLGPEPANELRSHLDECDDCRALVADAARAHTGNAPIVHVQVGDILGKKYLVEELLGAGGMGSVFRGRHIELARPVAIKVMHPALAEDATAVRRLAREARATAALTSPHTVRILDTDRGPSGAPYIVMELLDGQDLGALLVREGPLPVARVLDVGLQACAGLSDAHGHGIVHRDLKPSNLLRTRDGTIKIVDFGLAKRLPFFDQSMAGDTRTKTLIGSPQYMAPEQIQAPKDVDQRIDVWGLGATLYTLLAGAPPFNGPNLHVVCMRILKEAPPPLGATRGDVPEALIAAILRCLEKDRERRFATIAALAVALRAIDEALGAPGPAAGGAAITSAPRTRRADSLPPTEEPPEVERTLKDSEASPRASGTAKPRHESLVVALRRDDPRRAPIQHLLRGASAIVVGRGDRDHAVTRSDAVIELRLDDPHLSSRHFSLERVREGDSRAFRLLDLGSTNGTLLNGVAHREGLLVDRDVIDAGRTSFVFRAFDGPPALEPVLSLPEDDGLTSMAPAMQAILRALPQVATARLLVVLEGEEGTPKEPLAQAVHRLSRRAGPFVLIRGSRFDDGQLASAQGGTLFVDEIAALPLVAQERLLHRARSRDLRLVLGTDAPLRILADQRVVLDELASRKGTATIKVPPLRERPEDVGLLVRASLARGDGSHGGMTFSSAAARALLAYSWPGDVRELEEVVTQLARRTTGGPIRTEDLPATIGAPAESAAESMGNSEARTPRIR